jgi:hypothetical protein
MVCLTYFSGLASGWVTKGSPVYLSTDRLITMR